MKFEIPDEDAMTAFDVLDTISSEYYGKQVYFLQENGRVYSRISCMELSFDVAVDEFADIVRNL